MKRRKFLEAGVKAVLTAPLVFNKSFSLLSGSAASHLVSVFDREATFLDMRPGQSANPDGVIVDKVFSYAVNRARVYNMVDTAIKRLTGRLTVGEAWESLFPAGHPTRDTTISIKINLSYGEREKDNDWSKTLCPFGPKAEVTDAIVHGLGQMLGGTFPVENILIFDTAYSTSMRRLFPLVQGYRPVRSTGWMLQKDHSPGTYGLHWVTPKHPLEIPVNAPTFVAAPDFPEEYRAPQRVAPAVYERDFMINVAIPKTHREAGVTGVMKNLYGVTDNPFGTHGTTWQEPDSPYPGSRRCAPAFYQSLHEITPCILNVMDALGGLYYGGPLSGQAFQANTISMSRDPVAIDTWSLNLINRHRRRKGYTVLTTEDGWTSDGFPQATFLRIAEEKHHLGSTSMDGVYHYDLTGSRETYDIPVLEQSQSRVSNVIRKRRRYQLDVSLDHSRRMHRVTSSIENVNGDAVKTFQPRSTRSRHLSLSWDHTDESKNVVADDLYIWRVEVDGIVHSRVVNDYA